jgi:hypothetical protein
VLQRKWKGGGMSSIVERRRRNVVANFDGNTSKKKDKIAESNVFGLQRKR